MLLKFVLQKRLLNSELLEFLRFLARLCLHYDLWRRSSEQVDVHALRTLMIIIIAFLLELVRSRHVLARFLLFGLVYVRVRLSSFFTGLLLSEHAHTTQRVGRLESLRDCGLVFRYVQFGAGLGVRIDEDVGVQIVIV